MKTIFNPVAIKSISETKIWLVLFIVGFTLGILACNFIDPYLSPVFKITFNVMEEASIFEMNGLTSSVIIFLKNAFIAMLCILTARLTFGIYPGFVVVFNGLIIGYLGKILVGGGNLTALQVFGGLAPHGVIELFGIFLACAIGFQKISLINKIKHSSLVWLLLLVAAITESTVTMMIVSAY